MFELQLDVKVCYNVKCKENMQAAADGCQSLLFLGSVYAGLFLFSKFRIYFKRKFFNVKVSLTFGCYDDVTERKI